MIMAMAQKPRPPASRQPAEPCRPVNLAMNGCGAKVGGRGGGVMGAGVVWGAGSAWGAGGAECGSLSIRSRAFARKAAVTGQLTTRFFSTLYHELFNEAEPGRGQVLMQLADWLGRQTLSARH